MNINTKEIYKGIVTVDGKPIRAGMLISELEDILNITIDKREEHCGYILTPTLIEDGSFIKLSTRFKGDSVKDIEYSFDGFRDNDTAHKFLEKWLKDRDITEWIGSDISGTYYKTEFGTLTPALVHHCYGTFDYAIAIRLKYGEVPSRKFMPIKENKSNICNLIIDEVEYKIQRITPREADSMPFLGNFLSDRPVSISQWKESYSTNDRMEIIYFNISKISDGVETVLGIAEFSYLAVLDMYNSSGLFLTLDGLTEEWGIIAHTIEKYGCGLESKKGLTPYILVFEDIHNEIPHNKEMSKFIENEDCMRGLYKSAIQLVSKYVKIPEVDITLVNVSSEKDNTFSYYKKCEDVFINYQRSEKNATVTKASGNASPNSLKYQLNIPAEWARQIGLTKEDKAVMMTFDGKTIAVTKSNSKNI
jgi:hypothetical protein